MIRIIFYLLFTLIQWVDDTYRLIADLYALLGAFFTYVLLGWTKHPYQEPVILNKHTPKQN